MKQPRMDRFDVNRDVPLPVRDESKSEPEPVMDELAETSSDKWKLLVKMYCYDALPMRKEDLGDKQ